MYPFRLERRSGGLEESYKYSCCNVAHCISKTVITALCLDVDDSESVSSIRTVLTGSMSSLILT